MLGRLLREHALFALTVQLKLRYTDFTTITRANTPESPTQLDTEIYAEIRKLFRDNWQRGRTVRLLGVSTSHFEESDAETPVGTQLDLLAPAPENNQHQRWGQAMATADKLRDKFGDRSVVLGTSLKRNLRERIHENPVERKKKDNGD